MATPAPAVPEATGLWQGGFSGPGLPALGGAVVIAAQLPDDGAGVLVSYAGGIFTRQFWTTGPPVPQIIEILEPDEVAAVRLHFQLDASHRFAEAVFGSITQSSPQGLQGQVTWPDDVIGAVLGNADGISAQSHLANVAAGNPAWLRSSDLRSLVIALNEALDTAQLDPLWKQMLAFAEQALT